MSILTSAKRRYSTKKFNPNRKISDSDIEALKTIFQLSPSSINIQPWHVLITNNDNGKQKITQAMQGDNVFNAQKVLDASHVMVLCFRTDVDASHLEKSLTKEQADGRINDKEFLKVNRETRSRFLALHSQTEQEKHSWLAHQVFLALGGLLLASADMGIDSIPMEGYDADILSEVLQLENKHLKPVVVVALGYRADDDFNATLPKSRFELAEIFTEIN